MNGPSTPNDRRAEHRCRRAEQLEREAKRNLQLREEAEAVAGPEIRADGSGEVQGSDIRPGDVCIDLAQGRPVHVINDTRLTAAEWSEQNNYELTENYGNSRLGATETDRVFDVVYCSNVKSKPSKDYAFPESRLVRVETEKADGGRAVYNRIVVDVLERLFTRVAADDEDAMSVLERYAADIGFEDEANEARELADAERLIGGEDGD